jgi:DNA-binding response OmpR family regulator
MRPVRVLIADPDESLLALYREALACEGFEVATATDGLDCLAKLRSIALDVLVLDLELLWGGGDGVLARMHEADVPPTKVLVLSGRRDLDRLYHKAALANSEYQIKPVPPDQLVERIRQLIEPFPPRDEGDRSPDDTERHVGAAASRAIADRGP